MLIRNLPSFKCFHYLDKSRSGNTFIIPIDPDKLTWLRQDVKKQNNHSQKQDIKVTPQGSFLLLLKKHKSKLKGINWKFPIQSFFLFQFQGRKVLFDFN